MSVNNLKIECDCKPVYLPFHESGENTFWSAYCPSCKRKLKWDINIKTREKVVELWKKTFGVGGNDG